MPTRYTRGQRAAVCGRTRTAAPTGPPLPTSNVGRIRLAFTRGANPKAMYAIINNPSNQTLLGVWKTTPQPDNSVTWAQTAHPETAPGTSGFSICSQCFY